MVRIERIKSQEPEVEIDPTGDRFKLVEVYVHVPSGNPSEESKVMARPYEFENGYATKYSTSCPHCGQGIWFERYTMQSAVDRFFISCPECEHGITSPIHSMIDPFLNPISEKIAEVLLDTDLSKAQDLKSNTGTVSEKIQNIDKDNDKQSEIEQLLEKLEGDSE